MALLLAPGLPAANDPGEEEGKILLWRLQGVLDGDGSRRLQDGIRGQLDRDRLITTIILELDSPGTRNGEVAPAREAAEFLRALKKVRVVVWIGAGREAGNACALLALAARDRILSPGARLGFRADPPASPERTEISAQGRGAIEEARAAFENLAPATDGPVGRGNLARAMAAPSPEPISRVTFERVDGNNKVEEKRYLTQKEIVNLPAAERAQKVAEVIIVRTGESLTLDQKKAFEFEFAKSIDSDELAAVLHQLGLAVGDDHIIDGSTGESLQPLPPSGQAAADFLNHPAVRFLLILIGILGFLFEFKLPGTLVPSIIGLLSFAIFFAAGFFPARGAGPTTNIFEVLLFTGGLALVAVEVFLLPGVLIFGLAGAAACLVGLVLALTPDGAGAAGPESLNVRDALTIILGSAGASVGGFILCLRYLPRTRFFDRSGMVIHTAIEGTPTADSAIEAQALSALLIGKLGEAVTPLRPAGAIEVEGKRLDVVTTGEFVEKGEQVVIIEVDGARTVVRPAAMGPWKA